MELGVKRDPSVERDHPTSLTRDLQPSPKTFLEQQIGNTGSIHQLCFICESVWAFVHKHASSSREMWPGEGGPVDTPQAARSGQEGVLQSCMAWVKDLEWWGSHTNPSELRKKGKQILQSWVLLDAGRRWNKGKGCHWHFRSVTVKCHTVFLFWFVFLFYSWMKLV